MESEFICVLVWRWICADIWKLSIGYTCNLNFTYINFANLKENCFNICKKLFIDKELLNKELFSIQKNLKWIFHNK